MQNKSRVWIWVGVVVVLIVIGYFIWVAVAPKNSGAAPVYAAKGTLIAGFPPSLVLDNSAQIGNSYSIASATSTNQYTAEWSSTIPMAALFNTYVHYFSANGWTIMNKEDDQATFRGIYAQTASSSANVTITAAGQGSTASVSYEGK
jgi:hypothetical protein